jgi:hypothetical protein
MSEMLLKALRELRTANRNASKLWWLAVLSLIHAGRVGASLNASEIGRQNLMRGYYDE